MILARALTLGLLLISSLVHAEPEKATDIPAKAIQKPERIAVGIFVNQVYAVDLRAGTFSADFWVWFRWSGESPSPLDTYELVGGRILSKASAQKKKLPDGSVYVSHRVNAIIHKQYALRDFPFDNHSLGLIIEDTERDLNDAIFVPDTANQGIDPTASVSGWKVAGGNSSLAVHEYHTNYGDTSLATGNASNWSRYTYNVELKREGSGRFFKFFFGLFIATLASWCAFFIRPKDASPRVSVSVGALFAAAAVTISINSQLPDVGYLTFADKMIFLSMGMILLSLLGTVSSLSLHYLNLEPAHRRLDKAGVFCFPLIYAVLLAVLLR